MRVKGRENVWAIGDAAAVPDPASAAQGAPPPTCQHALRAGAPGGGQRRGRARGRQAAAIPLQHARRVRGHGPHKAVATMLGVRLRGFPAWFAARSYHLPMMPGWRARCASMSTGPSASSSGAPPRSSASSGIRPLGSYSRVGRRAPARPPTVTELTFRRAARATSRPAFGSARRRGTQSRPRRGLLPAGPAPPDEPSSASEWGRDRPLLEFIAAQQDGCFLICEDERRDRSATRASLRFGVMDELTELWVAPSHAGRGIGRDLLERCWPDSPTPELGRIVVAAGTPATSASSPSSG